MKSTGRKEEPGRQKFALCDGRLPLRGEVAQLVEHTAENRGVAGSIPALAIHLMKSRCALNLMRFHSYR